MREKYPIAHTSLHFYVHFSVPGEPVSFAYVMSHELLHGQSAAVNLRLWSSLFCSDGEVPWGCCPGRDATHG